LTAIPSSVAVSVTITTLTLLLLPRCAATTAAARLLPRCCTAATASISTATIVIVLTTVATIVLSTALPWGWSTTSAPLLPRCGSTSGLSLPRRSRTIASFLRASASALVPADLPRWIASRATTQLVHQSFDIVLRAIDTRTLGRQIAEVLAWSTVWAVASHMTSVAANTTDDVCREVAGLRAVILAVTNLAAILASLVLVITKSTIEGGKLAQLVALELVLAFGNGGSLDSNVSENRIGVERCVTYCLDDIVDELLRLVDLLFGVGHDQAVQIFVLVAGVSSVRLALAFFDGAFAANGDLGAGLVLHLLERVTTRSNQQADC
jgi:hypothetical protein